MREDPMQLASLLEQTDFDYETAGILTTAFDEVWVIMKSAGGPLVGEDHAASTRTLLAKHIVDMAMQGERDLDRLVDGALGRLTGTA
jgi:hypothetical protein